MASPKTLAMRMTLGDLQPTREITPGTEVLPVFRKIRGERKVVSSRSSGMPYVNPAKDRSLRGKARRRVRRGGA